MEAVKTHLCHEGPGLSKDSFFKEIDRLGGWPVGAKYVSFEHNDERRCVFGNNYLRTGWWTTVAEADDYYIWKLSPDAYRKIEQQVKRNLLITVSSMMDEGVKDIK